DRTLRYEVAELTMAETPALVLKLIHDQIARGYDPAAHATARNGSALHASPTHGQHSPAARRRSATALSASWPPPSRLTPCAKTARFTPLESCWRCCATPCWSLAAA